MFQEFQTGLIEVFSQDLNICKYGLRHHLLHKRMEQIEALQKSTAFPPNRSLQIRQHLRAIHASELCARKVGAKTRVDLGY
jgi:hypothetical protein